MCPSSVCGDGSGPGTHTFITRPQLSRSAIPLSQPYDTRTCRPPLQHFIMLRDACFTACRRRCCRRALLSWRRPCPAPLPPTVRQATTPDHSDAEALGRKHDTEDDALWCCCRPIAPPHNRSTRSPALCCLFASSWPSCRGPSRASVALPVCPCFARHHSHDQHVSRGTSRSAIQQPRARAPAPHPLRPLHPSHHRATAAAPLCACVPSPSPPSDHRTISSTIRAPISHGLACRHPSVPAPHYNCAHLHLCNTRSRLAFHARSLQHSWSGSGSPPLLALALSTLGFSWPPQLQLVHDDQSISCLSARTINSCLHFLRPPNS